MIVAAPLTAMTLGEFLRWQQVQSETSAASILPNEPATAKVTTALGSFAVFSAPVISAIFAFENCQLAESALYRPISRASEMAHSRSAGFFFGSLGEAAMRGPFSNRDFGQVFTT